MNTRHVRVFGEDYEVVTGGAGVEKIFHRDITLVVDPATRNLVRSQMRYEDYRAKLKAGTWNEHDPVPVKPHMGVGR